MGADNISTKSRFIDEYFLSRFALGGTNGEYCYDARMGSTPKLLIRLAIVLAIPAGSSAKLQTQVARPDPLVAPFVKGQPLGTLKVSTGAGQPVADIPLVALEAVEESGVLGRAWDSIRLWIK